MSLFGSYRDDRRRRSLAEDSAGENFAATAAAAPKPTAKPQRYHPAARRENHRHTTDFVPRSPWSVALFFLAGLTIAGGLLAGFAWIADANLAKVAGLVELLDTSKPGNLLSWFSSLVFLLAAALSVLIYSVRRHKVDDYRGRYRLWIWCAMSWFVMSIDSTANLHLPFSSAMFLATGWSLYGNPAVWWVAVWGTILAILTVRLVFETRECRTAMLAVLSVVALWITALIVEFRWLPVGGHADLVAAGCRAIGQATLLLAIALFARHVLLDAEGLIAVREAKPRREKRPKKIKATPSEKLTDLESGKSTRIDAAHKPGDKQGGLASHVKAVSAASRSAANVATQESNTTHRSSRTDDDEDDDRYTSHGSSQRRYHEEDGDDEDQSKLSKAERKRLRKQMRRQNRDEIE